MKTLHTAYRVRDLDGSVDFYRRVGFREIGRVVLGKGATLVMLNLPGDGEVVTLELVYDPAIAFETGTGFSHVAVQVDDLAATLADMAGKGVACEAPELPGGVGGPKISNIRDPDGYRIELVEWPAGHPTDMTRADFVRSTSRGRPTDVSSSARFVRSPTAGGSMSRSVRQ